MILFIKWCTGDSEPNLDEISGSFKAKNNQELPPPITLILDTAHIMDTVSWRLFEKIKKCKRIAVILIMQTDEKDIIKIHPES